MVESLGNLLLVEGLVAGYGNKLVLNGVSLTVAPGEIVAVIGHNGAGKSTLLKAVFGVLPIWSGRIALDGTDLRAPSPRTLLRAGVTFVPQGNRVFGNLTVGENLRMSGAAERNRAMVDEGIERVLGLFPALRHRMRQRAGSLSGGEKQMLALASALVLSPRLLLLDEPSLGLAPQLVTAALDRIREISCSFGSAALIVEQKVREVLGIARRVYVLRNGLVSFSGPADVLREEVDVTLRDVYL